MLDYEINLKDEMAKPIISGVSFTGDRDLTINDYLTIITQAIASVVIQQDMKDNDREKVLLVIAAAIMSLREKKGDYKEFRAAMGKHFGINMSKTIWK